MNANSVVATTFHSTANYSNHSRTIEKSGTSYIHPAQWTTIATFKQNHATNTWRSASIFIEEAHSPSNGGDKGGGIWGGNFTYTFHTDGGRHITIPSKSIVRIGGTGGSIAFQFLASSTSNASSGASLQVYNYRESTNVMTYKFRFHSLDAFVLS